MAKCPLALKKVGGKGEDEDLVEWENWARNQLMAAGSDLLGKFSNLQVTLLLNLILMLQNFNFKLYLYVGSTYHG